MNPRLVLPLVALALAGCASVPDHEVVLLHAAYGTSRDVFIEGRVMESGDASAFDPADDARTNLRRNVSLFTADECEECPVRLALADLRPVGTETDDEGFFRVELEPPGPLEPSIDTPARLSADVPPGWQPLRATSGDGERLGEVLIVPPGNRLGIVSDIDDTVLVTEVGDRFRMLGNTFLKNPLQREAVPDMAALYARTLAPNPEPEAAPLFYLSSSPRELHTYLTGFLARNDFPRGVLVTRRLTFDREGFAQLDAIDYKAARLVEILERLPDVTFVLVGDDGEHDPEIYEEVRGRYPDRVAAIWIRRTNPLDASARALPEGQRTLAEVLGGAVTMPALPRSSSTSP